jgi:hypothetical protein
MSRAAGLLLVGGICLASSVGVAITGIPNADAHTAAVQITDQHCLGAVWAGTLLVTPTDLDKAPAATVSDDASPYKVTTFPYSTTVTTDTTPRTFNVHIVWNDGVTWNGTAALTPQPGACGHPTTTAPDTPTTTTCARAIPPRSDCGAVLTVPSEPTTVAIVESTVVESPTSSTVRVAVSSTAKPAPRQSSSVAPAPIYLPTTGGASRLEAAAGLFVLLFGVGLVGVAIRKREA